jgi:hypothetical protein
MAQLPNIKVPEIDTVQLNNTKYAKQILNYLMSLDESLRYMFGNLDDENMTSKFIKDLTVENILITNGENSIIGNPTDGFKLVKGTKVVMHLDIIKGDATFNGKVESASGNIGGWIITEDGLSNLNTNAKIKLYDGQNLSAMFEKSGIHFFDRFTAEGPYQGGLMVTHRSDGQEGYNSGLCLVQIGDADYISMGYTVDTEPGAGVIESDFIYTARGMTTSLGDYAPGFHFEKDVHFTNIFCSLLNDGVPITTKNKDNHTFKTSGYTGSFMTATGQTATVENGLITNIV